MTSDIIEPTNSNPNADLVFKCSGGNEFLNVLVSTTMLTYFENYIIPHDDRERVLSTFSKLAKVPKIEGPKFVFAHIISPHAPFIFDANGKLVLKKLQMDKRISVINNNYLNQLIFISKKVKVLVEVILSKSKVPPVIILQADHGPNLGSYVDGELDRIKWDHPSEEMIRERMGILNAYYLPPDGNRLLYDTISPVNTFRLILNYYFGANYPLLKDKSYHSPARRPYKFTDITDKARYD